MKNEGYVFKWPDLIRWGMHLPIGFIIAHMIMRVDVVLGVMVGVTFFLYEVLEDWRVADRSFKDVFGCLLMMIAGGYILRWCG